MDNDSKDHHERRCPRLGGPVSFEYCRGCGENKSFCWKVIDCWWEHFDIVAYLKDNLPEDKVAALMDAKPKPKITSLVELIAQAEKRTSK